MVKAGLFALVALLGVINVSDAQTARPSEYTEIIQLSGRDAQNILVAWEALKRAYEHDAALGEFNVSYTRADNAITVFFFKPPTITRHSDGTITIAGDSRSYYVDVDAHGPHVVPPGESSLNSPH
ncbi:MAG: hypothetical protein HY054_00230 [Proteobacteria bacterium]|nr:hypothetical protein [Pseudomonadota bacterium]